MMRRRRLAEKSSRTIEAQSPSTADKDALSEQTLETSAQKDKDAQKEQMRKTSAQPADQESNGQHDGQTVNTEKLTNEDLISSSSEMEVFYITRFKNIQ